SVPTAEAGAPSATAQPSAAAQPSTAPQIEAEAVDDPQRIAAVTPGERDQVALAEAFKHIPDIPNVARTKPLDVKVGDVESFWVSDILNNTNYTVTAKLRYAGPVALMYVDTNVESQIDQDTIERSAKQFEERIYPRDHALFGQERSPGIDDDPRLTILNTPLR